MNPRSFLRVAVAAAAAFALSPLLRWTQERDTEESPAGVETMGGASAMEGVSGSSNGTATADAGPAEEPAPMDGVSGPAEEAQELEDDELGLSAEMIAAQRAAEAEVGWAAGLFPSFTSSFLTRPKGGKSQAIFFVLLTRTWWAAAGRRCD